MKKQIALFSLVTAALVAVPTINFAQDANTTPPAVKKHAGQTFAGKITAVDTTANTVTVAAADAPLTLNITSSTKITKDKNPATLADFAVGDSVDGTYKKYGDKLNAIALHNGKGKKKKAE